MTPDLRTPYELGNHNQTTTWQACIAFYQELAALYPQVLQFTEIGLSDAGLPIHAGVVSSDGVFSREQIQAEGRPIFFNNNGIHPGEPEGIDACMAIVRDFCTHTEKLAHLGRCIFLFIPIYNVDGAVNRGNTSRVNQVGPEQFGFRGNKLHLDLNRDFIKCDSLAAQCFNRFFAAWQPDVMVDTHTSNGADYPYTMTLIATQPDKMGGVLGNFLRQNMLPAIYQGMWAEGWPTVPYVNPMYTSPHQGIVDFLETPRFSTGYAALHHCLGFMPETHMLKPYADRYQAMRVLIEVVLEFTIAHANQIQVLRAQAKRDHPEQAAICWELDADHPSRLLFQGYQAVYKPSEIGNYQRLSYDREHSWDGEIDYYDRFLPSTSVSLPQAYLIPQEWRSVIERLNWNGVVLEKLTEARLLEVEYYQISHTNTRPGPYEGHMFHDEVELQSFTMSYQASAGDYLLSLAQPGARYAIESLEPQAHDSFFRWGFFNSVLEKKETYSDYVFEDEAQRLLEAEPALKEKFTAWKQANPKLLEQQEAVLDFIFANCERYREPEWRRYPIMRVMGA